MCNPVILHCRILTSRTSGIRVLPRETELRWNRDIRLSQALGEYLWCLNERVFGADQVLVMASLEP